MCVPTVKLGPENRLIAAELELRWNRTLARVGEIEAKIAAHDTSTPRPSPLLATDLSALTADLINLPRIIAIHMHVC